MITHDIQQGTPEWHAFRAAHITATDAAVILGASPYKTRSELMIEKVTGVTPEVDSATQKRFDKGHRFEALARPLAEEIIGAELYPVVGSNGIRSASFDGLTMAEDICFEHKTLNDEIRACQTVGQLPLLIRIQMEQQLMVSDAGKCLFMATNWDDDGNLVEDPVVFWYEPDAALRQRILDETEQFQKDKEEYRYVAPESEATGRAPGSLPALRIESSGMVTVASLREFKARAMEVLDAINTDLQTDEDFATAKATVKWCKSVEDQLDAEKRRALLDERRRALSHIASIEEQLRTLDDIKETSRQRRLTLDKLVKQRETSIRFEKIEEARKKFHSHVAGLQEEIDGVMLNIEAPLFGEAIKGLKTLSSVQNAIDTSLASAKIEANARAKDVRDKLAWYKAHAADYDYLFRDMQQIIDKPMDDFVLTVTSRIEQKKKEEAARIEAERERIRKEEAEKLIAMQQQAKVPAQAVEDAKPAASPPVHVAEPMAARSSKTLTLEDINAAVLAEREACARACEEVGLHPSSLWAEPGCWEHASKACAERIRARGAA